MALALDLLAALAFQDERTPPETYRVPQVITSDPSQRVLEQFSAMSNASVQ
jgi:hypothetical protein